MRTGRPGPRTSAFGPAEKEQTKQRSKCQGLLSLNHRLAHELFSGGVNKKKGFLTSKGRRNGRQKREKTGPLVGGVERDSEDRASANGGRGRFFVFSGQSEHRERVKFAPRVVDERECPKSERERMQNGLGGVEGIKKKSTDAADPATGKKEGVSGKTGGKHATANAFIELGQKGKGKRKLEKQGRKEKAFAKGNRWGRGENS